MAWVGSPVNRNFILEKAYFRLQKKLDKKRIDPSYIDTMKRYYKDVLRIYATRDIPDFGMAVDYQGYTVTQKGYRFFSGLKIIIPLEVLSESVGLVPETVAYVNNILFPTSLQINREKQNTDLDLLGNISKVCLGDTVPKRFDELRSGLFDDLDRINEALTDVEVIVTTNKDRILGGEIVTRDYLTSWKIRITNDF